jgi:hypothetical protein
MSLIHGKVSHMQAERSIELTIRISEAFRRLLDVSELFLVGLRSDAG